MQQICLFLLWWLLLRSLPPARRTRRGDSHGARQRPVRHAPRRRPCRRGTPAPATADPRRANRRAVLTGTVGDGVRRSRGREAPGSARPGGGISRRRRRGRRLSGLRRRATPAAQRDAPLVRRVAGRVAVAHPRERSPPGPLGAAAVLLAQPLEGSVPRPAVAVGARRRNAGPLWVGVPAPVGAPPRTPADRPVGAAEEGGRGCVAERRRPSLPPWVCPRDWVSRAARRAASRRRSARLAGGRTPPLPAHPAALRAQRSRRRRRRGGELRRRGRARSGRCACRRRRCCTARTRGPSGVPRLGRCERLVGTPCRRRGGP